jgi:hypothetical protein
MQVYRNLLQLFKNIFNMIYIEIKKDENIIFSNVNECSSKDILKLSKNVKIKEKNIISNTTRTTS